MNKSWMLLTACLLIICNGDSEALAQELRSYYIVCDSADFAYIVNHPEDRFYIDCSFEFDGVIWDDARIRLRGESSLEYPKKSFKVNFDADNRYYGRDKVNLISEWIDPTFSHEYLSYDLYQQAGLFASSTWFVKMYVNGDYMGLFLDVEQIDEHYLSMGSLPDDASIYKADDYGCVLSLNESVEEIWEKKTNETSGFYDLCGLIEWLDTTPDDQFFEVLNDHFDVQYLARVIAVNALCGNQSTYYHNYYMIHDIGKNGHWYFVPWDMDKTFGYWSSYENPNYFRSGHQLLSTLNQLTSRCWLDESMRELIYNELDDLTENVFTQSYYIAKTEALTDLLYDAVAADTFKQFTTEQFLTDLAEIPIEVVSRSISIEDRVNHDPLPFDIYPAVISPSGVYFSWRPTTSNDGSNISYELWIGDNLNFDGDLTIIDGLTETSLLYDGLSQGNHYWRVVAVTDAGGATRSLSFFHKIKLKAGSIEGTIVTSLIDTDTTWDLTGSPYSLPEGLTISQGAVLSIEPGVMVGIGSGKSIVIEGGLSAVGIVDDSIRFVPLNPASDWASIIIDNPSGEALFSYVSIIGSSSDGNGPVAVPGGMIQVSQGALSIYDSNLSSGASGALSTDSSAVHLERVTFSDFYSSDLIFIRYGCIAMRSCSYKPGQSEQSISDVVDINWVVDESEITGCSFFGCNDDMIDLDGVQNLDISRNTIRGAFEKGINLGYASTNISISNNIVTACSIGVGLKDHSSAVLFNNVSTLNKVGFAIFEGDSLQAVARNNVFWNNDDDIHYSPTADLTIEYCLTGETLPFPSQGNLSTDPLFVDPWNLNLYPQAYSPLIDAGYGTDQPPLDIDYHERLDALHISNTGAGEIDYVDIGVIEFDPEGKIIGPPPEPPQVEVFTLAQNYPNPFNSATRIEFTIQDGSWAEVEVFDITGRRVYHRSFTNQNTGPISMIWNGTSNAGSYLSSGIYLCRVRQKMGSQTIKMALLK